MAQLPPPDFSEFEPLPAPRPNTKEREGAASATVAEAEAPFASRKAAAETAKAEADAKRAAALAAADERKAAEAAAKTEASQATAVRDRAEKMETVTGYLGQLQRARDVLSSGVATGPVGQITGGIWGTPAADLKGILESIANPVVLEAMAEARKGSAAGATGFGALSQKELELLKGKFGSLRQSQDPESLLRTIDEIEKSYRRLMAYNAGYDPYSVEGAMLVGLPLPEDAEIPPPEDVDIGPAGGTWTEDPELRGVDAAVISMIKAGRSADQIRAWLNSYQEGLGGRITGLEGQIEYYKKTGKDPQGVVGKQYTPPEEVSIASQLADTGPGAMAVAATDQLLSGFMSEASAGELSGPEYERRAAIQRGLRDKYPGWSTAGDVGGAVLSTMGGVAAGAKTGLKLPSILEGVGQETLYGIGSSEPGQRVEGGMYSATLAPITNIGGKVVGDVVGTALQGAEPSARALAERYGINLTPGQLTGKPERERFLAGLPLVGPQVTARRNETLEQFNRAAFDDALAPIGTRTQGVGQAGIAEAQQAVSDAYDSALGGRVFQIDTPFLQVVRGKPYADLTKMKGDLGPKAAAEIDRILGEAANSGTIDGRAWQQARRQLVNIQGAKEVKNDIGGDAVRNNLEQIIDAFDDVVARQAPDAAEGYFAANTAYRNLKILERAVDNAPQGDIFGPGNLRTATKLGTKKFGGASASARGDRPFNDLVMNALGKVPDRADDVSLAGRVAAPIAGAGGAGALVGVNAMSQPENDRVVDEGDGTLPPSVLAIAAGAGGMSVPYSRRGVAGMRALMGGPRSDTQRTLGRLLQTYGPAALRGVVRDAEPDAPMPQDFDYSQMGSPQLREIMRLAVEGGQPLSPEERGALDLGGFQSTYTDVGQPATGGMSIDGRPVDRDPETGQMIFLDTGEPVPGFKRGGKVAQPTWGDRARSVAKGATFAFNDEIEAGLRALAQLDPAAYQREVTRVRAEQKAYEDANPWESLAYEAGGSLLPSLIPGAQGATGARLAQLATKYPRASRLGMAAGEGAVYGVGNAESMSDIPRSVAEEAAFGAAMYGAGDTAVRGGRRIYRKVRAK